MIMIATVLRVQDGNLLVFDHRSSQRVIVHTPNAWRFRAGQNVRIHFNGIMTASLPPQITASRITVIGCGRC